MQGWAGVPGLHPGPRAGGAGAAGRVLLDLAASRACAGGRGARPAGPRHAGGGGGPRRAAQPRAGGGGGAGVPALPGRAPRRHLGAHQRHAGGRGAIPLFSGLHAPARAAGRRGGPGGAGAARGGGHQEGGRGCDPGRVGGRDAAARPPPAQALGGAAAQLLHGLAGEAVASRALAAALGGGQLRAGPHVVHAQAWVKRHARRAGPAGGHAGGGRVCPCRHRHRWVAWGWAWGAGAACAFSVHVGCDRHGGGDRGAQGGCQQGAWTRIT